VNKPLATLIGPDNGDGGVTVYPETITGAAPIDIPALYPEPLRVTGNNLAVPENVVLNVRIPRVLDGQTPIEFPVGVFNSQYETRGAPVTLMIRTPP
jgi:hypothetical protein